MVIKLPLGIADFVIIVGLGCTALSLIIAPIGTLFTDHYFWISFLGLA